MTSSFLGRRSSGTQRLPHRLRAQGHARTNLVGRSIHRCRGIPARSGVHQNVAAHPLFGADDVVRSAWIRVQRGLRAPGDGVWFLRSSEPSSGSTWAPVLLNRTFRFRWKIRGLNMRRWRPRNGCGRDLASSPRWKSQFRSPTFRSKILPTVISVTADRGERNSLDLQGSVSPKSCSYPSERNTPETSSKQLRLPNARAFPSDRKASCPLQL